jgi:hypothetical protein
MSVFDYSESQSDLTRSFNQFVASMDDSGTIECSKEELITWCAPAGNQFMNSKWGYVASRYHSGVSLQMKIDENYRPSEEEIAALE